MSHDAATSAHRGNNNTLEKVLRQYRWPTLASDATEYLRDCRLCQRIKATTQRLAGLLQRCPLLTCRAGVQAWPGRACM